LRDRSEDRSGGPPVDRPANRSTDDVEKSSTERGPRNDLAGPGPSIGGLTLDSRLVLAPMAGIADGAFRAICVEKGASLVYTEMVSADGLIRGNDRTLALLSFSEKERPIGIQLFGSEPGTMARAAEKAVSFSPDLVDLNFGCPARKVVGRQAGCALLNNLSLLRKITSAVVTAVDVPVTAKIRSGWDRKTTNAEKVSRILEDCGVKAVAVHARSRADKFRGRADWEVIARVKRAVRIPVVGNGDVASPEDAARMLEETGCDAVMIGRGALGNPWLFSRARRYLSTGESPAPPSVSGEDSPALAMRKHVAWYTKGLPGSSKVRQTVNQVSSWNEMRRAVVEFADSLGVADRLTSEGFSNAA
jgi:tRNA-dihydrouridine synthase B